MGAEVSTPHLYLPNKVLKELHEDESNKNENLNGKVFISSLLYMSTAGDILRRFRNSVRSLDRKDNGVMKSMQMLGVRDSELFQLLLQRSLFLWES